ncbi:L-threonylcarbamoyladenylate synthase [Zhongshania arctica]|uniref:Threonylcarbamoyl-AMP synthase n=1 Tax=Zhongshania arctica TaxID=3238302 RepID=A0ABV3TYE9_9GAMM
MALYTSSQESIAHAAGVLRRGGLIAFPTETVYGLGADAINERAVASIFTAKGRPADHPLIVHVSAASEIEYWARDIPDAAWELAERFWPGPLTLILKRAPGVLDAVTGGQDTIGLRVPDHPVALALLRAFGSGVAAPSANRFGRVSSTSATHVMAEFGDAVDGVIDGGCCQLGLESTILDLSGKYPRVLRPGSVMPDILAQILGQPLGVKTEDAPRVSGSMDSHYAPDTPLRLVEAGAVKAAAQSLLDLGHSIAVLSQSDPAPHHSRCRWLSMPNDPKPYGQSLYAHLREVDTWACEYLLVEQPPSQMAWDAVRDRLQRASGSRQGARSIV